MNEIFQYVVSGVLLYALSKLVDHYVNPVYPEGAKLELFRRRFEVYKGLYYRYCYDFQTGKKIEVEELKILYGDILSFYHSHYLKDENMSELLSLNMQKRLRKVVASTSNKDLKMFQRQISNDYRVICKEMRYSLMGKLVSPLDFIFYGFSLFGLIAIFSALFLAPLSSFWSLALTAVGTFLVSCAYFVAYKFLHVNF